jgi:hypothetical protein
VDNAQEHTSFSASIIGRTPLPPISQTKNLSRMSS